ncbi:hypothetical protein MXD61_00275 [Frankia sp. AgPm24]|uniref:PIN domain-containing protein n=1 Tax=Frankia umida TaxID=573489 RepID=A0ABT0JXZ7_9ACTN|nr:MULTISPECIES: hypothetical protein [Frankia]MCK9876412.1 hypothetical protein [Frankia umida]MCK9920363.1 hypothetical protein [Frankia sp. AgPm24]
MTVLLFPDNTVLINFAIINRMDLLERLVKGNGRWCATVESECRRSARVPGLDVLGSARRIFGAPWLPDAAELQDAMIMRDGLAGPGDSRHHHLGEAETLAIMTRRRVKGLFVTDDRAATRLAARSGITAITTWHLLKASVRSGMIKAETLWRYTITLRDYPRALPVGVAESRASFDAWLAS